ncbi:hypothetical protein OF83DRAFT_1238254 [Amylostereum chailletii]|nr:hypothetical protein OF83DRAFT_1238254 [Amylostereum chailletii]
MSAIRRNDRRAVRTQMSSPYKRPTKQKSSGWSLSGLLSYIIPSRLMKAEESEEQEQWQQQEQVEAGESRGTHNASDEGARPSQPAMSLSQRGHQLAARQPISTDSTHLPNLSQTSGTSHNPITLNSNSPPSTPGPSSRPQVVLRPSPSPAKNLDAVKQYLHDRKNSQPLHQVELIGLMSLLQGSVEEEEKVDEPFRFSSSQPPSRSASPIFNPGSPTQTTKRTLSKNPNGTYKWQGAGSARPRHRYQSPAFGSPRPSPSRIRLSPPTLSKTDSKRRRVGEEAETSSPQRVKATSSSTSPLSPTRGDPVFSTSSFPISNISASTSASSSSTMSGSSPSKPSVPPVPATPRLRAAVLPKPTAPAVPSPLRNGWGQSDSSSPPQQQSTPPKKPTKAANFMSELIKEVTPPKKPDVANPYQAALPARVPVTKRAVKKRKAPEETQPVTKEKETQKEKESKEKDELAEMSPQRIIEATVPKGSRRARPPANLEKQSSPKKFNGLNGSTPLEPPRRSARLKSPEPSDTGSNGFNDLPKSKCAPSVVVVEEEDEDERPSPKKQRTAFSMAPTIEEVEDVDMPDANKSKSGSSLLSRPTEIIEPGDASNTGPSKSPVNGTGKAGFGPKSSIPKEPSKLRFGFAAEPDEDPSSSKTSATPSAPGPSSKPDVVLSPPVPAASIFVDPKAAATSLAAFALPKFSFTIPPSDNAVHDAQERAAAKALPSTSLPSFSFTIVESNPGSFNWAAAGMKAPTKPGEGSWTCGSCMLSNPASAKDCTVCEAPAPAAASAPPVSSGFNWAAAGMKAPAKASGGSWTCGTCMLSNSADVKDCTVCEAPRP